MVIDIGFCKQADEDYDGDGKLLNIVLKVQECDATEAKSILQKPGSKYIFLSRFILLFLLPNSFDLYAPLLF